MNIKSNDNNLTVNKINDKFFWDSYSRPVNAQVVTKHQFIQFLR